MDISDPFNQKFLGSLKTVFAFNLSQNPAIHLDTTDGSLEDYNEIFGTASLALNEIAEEAYALNEDDAVAVGSFESNALEAVHDAAAKGRARAWNAITNVGRNHIDEANVEALRLAIHLAQLTAIRKLLPASGKCAELADKTLDGLSSLRFCLTKIGISPIPSNI